MACQNVCATVCHPGAFKLTGPGTQTDPVELHPDSELHRRQPPFCVAPDHHVRPVAPRRHVTLEPHPHRQPVHLCQCQCPGHTLSLLVIVAGHTTT
eukprot:185640-Rhodomonas_salina.1